MDKSYKKKTLISTLSLFFQSGYSAILGLVANVILTIVVSPVTFGIYITILSIIAIFNYFSDIGLAAALIQRKEINDNDLKTSFTIQQSMVLILITIGFFSTNLVKKFYHLPQNSLILYHAVLISFFLSSLKTIPSVLLERKIEFQKIVFVQIIENTFFYLSVIIFSLLKFDLFAFVVAVLARSTAGLILIYSLSFWLPKIGFDKESFKKLVSFGLPFQTNSLLALIKDDLMILYLGKILGFEKLGYIGFAKKWAEAPIRIIMDNVSKVIFPLMARFQEEKEKLKNILEKILFYQSIAILPAILGISLIMPRLTEIIPKYSKWQPALPILYIFSAAAIFSSYSTPFINFFNSIGKVKISFYFMVFWTALTWILTPILTKMFNLYGFPLTLLILSLTFILVLNIAKTIVKFSFLKPTMPAIFSSLIMFLAVFTFLKITITPLYSLFLAIFLGIISYTLSLTLIFKINLLKIYRLFYEK
ncbi:MAG: oligosaccharide flippase family protein [Microgenomates group bacterium]